MNATVDVITIGVIDLKRARDFYEQAFGCLVKEDRPDSVTRFSTLSTIAASSTM